MRTFIYNHQDAIETTLLVGAVAALIIGVCALIIAVGKVTSEAGCNTTGDEYGLEADYRFFANTCFVTLDDGRKVNADNIQAYEEGR